MAIRLWLASWLDPRPRLMQFTRLDGKRGAVDTDGNVWVSAWRVTGEP